MKKSNSLGLLLMLLILANSCKDMTSSKPVNATKAEKEERLVSLNGTVSEILSELGHKNEIVAVDVTSSYPKNLKDSATDLGHVMNLSIEALLQEKPTQIFAVAHDLSDNLRKQLEELKVPVHYYEHEYSAEGAKKLIRAVAKDLNTGNADELIAEIDDGLQNLKSFGKKPKVMFIYARGAGTLLVAGTNTPAASIIELAGGTNVVYEYEGYKPLTTEAVAKANPDVLLLFDTGLKSINGIEGLKGIPGLSTTTAVKQEQIVAMDGLLLTGFGPRLGEAAKKLNEELSKYAE